MSTEGWHYFANRLNGDGTETLIANDLPLSNVTLTNTLSSFGSTAIEATVPVEITRLKGTDEPSIFLPRSTALYAERGGLIRCGGIVKDAPVTDNTCSISCMPFGGFMTGYPYSGAAKAYVKAEAYDIAKYFWSWLQSQANANIGVTLDLDPSKTGVLLGTKEEDVSFTTGSGEDVNFTAGPWTMNYWDTTDLGARWDDLAKDAGFDYYETHKRVGETIQHTIHLRYPAAGSRRTDLRFKVGENIKVVPEYGVSADDFATDIIVLGAGEGKDMVRGEAHIAGSNRLSTPVVVTDQAIRSTKQANNRAATLAKTYGGDDNISEVVIQGNHSNAPYGSYNVGDTITVIGSGYGWMGDRKMSVRLTETSVSPDANDDVTCSVGRSDKIGGDGG